MEKFEDLDFQHNAAYLLGVDDPVQTQEVYIRLLIAKVKEALQGHSNVRLTDMNFAVISNSTITESEKYIEEDETPKELEKSEETITEEQLPETEKHLRVAEMIDDNMLLLSGDSNVNFVESIVVREPKVAEILPQLFPINDIKIVVRQDFEKDYMIRYQASDKTTHEIGG